MPKIKITESDNTGTTLLDQVSNVVYVPGAIATTGTKAIDPVLFSSVTAFDKVASSYADDLSHKLARRLIQAGMQVLYEGFVLSNNIITIDWTKLQDKALYDIRFLTTGGYACPTGAMIECASTRGDCVALLDHPDTIADTVAESGETVDNSQVAKVRRYFENVSTSVVDSGSSSATSYSSAFTPWYKSSDTNLGATSSATVDIPASFGYLLAYATSAQTYPVWYAAAGSVRGIIPGLSGVTYEYTNAECEELQARASTGEVALDGEGDNVGRAINPIAYVRPFGYIIWGNRTFRNNLVDEGTKATSFLNVRNLSSELKKTLYNAARKFTFEQNSNVLWINFTSQITPLLDKMVSGNGILGYRIVRQSTSKKARMAAVIYISPIEAVEDFELEVNLTDSVEVVEA